MYILKYLIAFLIIYINLQLDQNGIMEGYELQKYLLYIQIKNNVIHISFIKANLKTQHEKEKVYKYYLENLIYIQKYMIPFLKIYINLKLALNEIMEDYGLQN